MELRDPRASMAWMHGNSAICSSIEAHPDSLRYWAIVNRNTICNCLLLSRYVFLRQFSIFLGSYGDTLSNFGKKNGYLFDSDELLCTSPAMYENAHGCSSSSWWILYLRKDFRGLVCVQCISRFYFVLFS